MNKKLFRIDILLLAVLLRPMSVHLSNNNKTARSPCSFVQIPSSSSPPPLPPLLDAALLTVVQQQQQPSRTPPPGFDRNQYEHILFNFAGVRSSLSSSPSPKLPKTGTGGTNNIPPPPPSLPSSSNCPPPTQHHVPLLTTHSFLYNPGDPCIFPIAMPPGFPSASPDFMRLFAPNMAAVAAAANTNNPSGASFVTNSNGPQGPMSNSRSTSQSNGTNTPPEQNGQNLHHSSPSITSAVSRAHQYHQQPHYRHRQHHLSDSNQFQQNGSHLQQRQSQTSYPQQQHNRQKACYTCGDIGHLAFACPEQYSSDSNYPHNTRGKNQIKLITKEKGKFLNILDGYKLDYRPRQSTPTNLHQQQRQMRSNSNSKTKVRDNS
jgi:hypothetical protein